MGLLAEMRSQTVRASLLALLVLLALGLGALVPASPAEAANAAVEGLYDHDQDATTTEVRQFAGTNRYATSLNLARAFAERANAGTGFVDTLILASGERLTDAAIAIGLAASRSAPVVLTVPNRLSRSVERFIIDEFIAEVTIIGGTDAVSQAVEDALGEIDTLNSVRRIDGDDRYGTSVLVAEEMSGDSGTFCNTNQPAAVLVNVDGSLADAVSVGPLAYAMRLPILLTAAAELPTAVAAYLTETKIERVIVVGGTASISEEVTEEIFAAGVDAITHIAGSNRFSTAVAVRSALADCAGVTLNNSTLALANADIPADGISAAPLLGQGLDDTSQGVTAVLLTTTDSLPTETRDYLAGIPTHTLAGEYVNLEITALGGVSAVPDAVVQKALEAARTSELLTANIFAQVGWRAAVVTFSEPVNLEADESSQEFATSALNPAHYTINGNPLVVGDSIQVSPLVSDPPGTVFFAPSGTSKVVGVVLSSYFFTAGDVIAVVGDRISGEIVTSGITDNRRVASSAFTVPENPDTTRPRVSILAPESGYVLRIEARDDGPNRLFRLPLEGFDTSRVTLNGVPLSDIQTTAGVSPAAVIQDFWSRPAHFITDFLSYRTIFICLFGISTDDINRCEATPPEGLRFLRPGDVIGVEARTFRDLSSNFSRRTLERVRANNPKPTVIDASVTRLTPYNERSRRDLSGNAIYTWADLNGPGTNTAAPNTNSVTYLLIRARDEGIASGAAGNDWTVSWYALPPDEDTTPEAIATVLERRKIIRIGFDEEATLHTVVNALLKDETLITNFEIYSEVLANNDLGAMLLAGIADGSTKVFDPADILTRSPSGAEVNKPTVDLIPLTGGQSSVILTLTFDDILSELDLVALRDANAKASASSSGNFPVASNWLFTSTAGRRFSYDRGFRGQISVRVHSGSLDDLPVAGDTIELPAGFATNFDGQANDRVAAQRLRDAGTDSDLAARTLRGR